MKSREANREREKGLLCSVQYWNFLFISYLALLYSSVFFIMNLRMCDADESNFYSARPNRSGYECVCASFRLICLFLGLKPFFFLFHKEKAMPNARLFPLKQTRKGKKKGHFTNRKKPLLRSASPSASCSAIAVRSQTIANGRFLSAYVKFE